jgi:secretion/DNA translocation related TadE-like protein
MNDDGFAAVLLVVLLALAGLLCLATADAANVLVTRSRAQNAADAAALAAAVAQWPFVARGEAPDEAAARTAERNGARLESCDCEIRASYARVTVSIRTRVRMLGVAPSRVVAKAEATFEPGRMFSAP